MSNVAAWYGTENELHALEGGIGILGNSGGCGGPSSHTNTNGSSCGDCCGHGTPQQQQLQQHQQPLAKSPIGVFPNEVDASRTCLLAMLLSTPIHSSSSSSSSSNSASLLLSTCQGSLNPPPPVPPKLPTDNAAAAASSSIILCNNNNNHAAGPSRSLLQSSHNRLNASSSSTPPQPPPQYVPHPHHDYWRRESLSNLVDNAPRLPLELSFDDDDENDTAGTHRPKDTTDRQHPLQQPGRIKNNQRPFVRLDNTTGRRSAFPRPSYFPPPCFSPGVLTISTVPRPLRSAGIDIHDGNDEDEHNNQENRLLPESPAALIPWVAPPLLPPPLWGNIFPESMMESPSTKTTTATPWRRALEEAFLVSSSSSSSMPPPLPLMATPELHRSILTPITIRDATNAIVLPIPVALPMRRRPDVDRAAVSYHASSSSPSFH